jgi:hypothetical protein
MEMVNVTVSVPKGTMEMCDSIANVAIVTKNALKDGFQAGQDLPVIVTSAIAVLPGIMSGAKVLGEEFKANKAAFVMAWLLAGEKVFESFSA